MKTFLGFTMGALFGYFVGGALAYSRSTDEAVCEFLAMDHPGFKKIEMR